jgi:hypothetical protein
LFFDTGGQIYLGLNLLGYHIEVQIPYPSLRVEKEEERRDLRVFEEALLVVK